MRARLLLLLCVGFGLAGAARGQSGGTVSVEASARPSMVQPDGTVTFVLRVTGAERSAIETPDAPSTRNLVLQSPTPTTRQDVSFEEGTMRRTVTFEWTYRPLQAGTARLRPATVVVEGEPYTTAEVRVEVTPQAPAAPPSGASSPPALDGMRTDRLEAARLEPRSLFIRGDLSAETAYRNEQVTVTYRLFFRPRVRLRQSRMTDAWDAPGFWREELDVSARPTPQSTTAFGQTYKTIVLKRVALFPTQPGTLRVDPLRIETQAQGAGDGVRGRYEPVTLSSQALSVRVRPLPTEAPSSFRGAVGQFAVEARADADSVAVGTGVDLNVRVQGAGNLSTLSPPTLPVAEGLDTYGPEVNTALKRGGAELQGTKTFTYTLVPRTGGRHVVPEVPFTYFDPQAGRYRTTTFGPVSIHATGTAEPTVAGRTGGGLPVNDIAGLMTTASRWTAPSRPPLHRQWWPYLLLLVPVGLTIAGIAYRRRSSPRRATSADDATDPLAAARSHLRDARRHRRTNDQAAFYRAVEQAVRAFLAHRLNADATLSPGRFDQQLARHDVPAADREALRALFETCDRARFSPEAPAPDTDQDTLTHTRTLLRRLHDALPPA